MKRLIVVFIVALAMVATASAQDVFEKGNITMGGSASFTMSSGDLYENADGDGSSSFGFYPSAGYFVMDNLSVGLGIGFDSYSRGDYSSGGMSFGPHVHYYLAQMGPGNPFGHLGYTMGSRKWDPGTANSVETKESFSTLSLGAGYIYFLNDKVGVTGALIYEMDSETQKEPTELDSESGTQLIFRFGFRMFL